MSNDHGMMNVSRVSVCDCEYCNLRRMGLAEVVHRMVSIRIDPDWPMCCCHFVVESMLLVVAPLRRYKIQNHNPLIIESCQIDLRNGGDE